MGSWDKFWTKETKGPKNSTATSEEAGSKSRALSRPPAHDTEGAGKPPEPARARTPPPHPTGGTGSPPRGVRSKGATPRCCRASSKSLPDLLCGLESISVDQGDQGAFPYQNSSPTSLTRQTVLPRGCERRCQPWEEGKPAGESAPSAQSP